MMDVLNKEVESLKCVVKVNRNNSSVTVKVGQRHFDLVGNFGNLSRLADYTGISESDVIMKMVNNDYAVHHIANIFYCLLSSDDTRLSVEEIGDHMIKEKLYFDYKSILVTVISLAVIGDPKEVKPGKKK